MKIVFLIIAIFGFIACESESVDALIDSEDTAEETDLSPKLSSVEMITDWPAPFISYNRFYDENRRLVSETFGHVANLYRSYVYDSLDRLVNLDCYNEDGSIQVSFTIHYEGELLSGITRFNYETDVASELLVFYDAAVVTIREAALDIQFVFADESHEQLLEVNRVNNSTDVVAERNTFEYDTNNNLIRFIAYVLDEDSGELESRIENTITYDTNPNPHKNMIYPGILLDHFFYSFERDRTQQYKRYNTNNYLIDTEFFPNIEHTQEFRMDYSYDADGYVLYSTNSIVGEPGQEVEFVYNYYE